jgi:hypothetical protein
MQWTQEQQPIVDSTAEKLLVQAFAGTGKTTTLVGYATHHASVKMLYLCYNKPVELAAKGRFPSQCGLQDGAWLGLCGLWQPIRRQTDQ